MAWQRLGRQWGQHWWQRQRTRLSDQLPVEDVSERTFNTVVDGAAAKQEEKDFIKINTKLGIWYYV